MKSHIHFRFFPVRLLLSAVVLLTATQVRAQKTSAEQQQSTSGWASLSLMFDQKGAATVTLRLPLKLSDATAMRRVLAKSVNFPLTFARTTGNTSGEDADEDTDDEDAPKGSSWTTISGRSDKPFSQRGLKSTCRIDMEILADSLRSLGVKHLGVGVFFQSQDVRLRVAGVTKLGAHGGPVDVNYYRTEIDLAQPQIAAIEFSMGYSTGDVARRSLLLLGFLMLPALLTLRMRWSILRLPDQGEIWGRCFLFWRRLLNLIWLPWIPVYTLSGMGEIVSFAIGPDHRVAVHTLDAALYLLPPLLALCLCHLLCGSVYRRVHGVDWSARHVIKRAILIYAAFLFPLIIIMTLIATAMTERSRTIKISVFVGLAGGVLIASLIKRFRKSSVYAVTTGELYSRVCILAHKAGVAVNHIYILPPSKARMANAFANRSNSLLISMSLVMHLSKREIDGLMAHELGHLKEKHPQIRGQVTLGVIIITNALALSFSSFIKVEHLIPVALSCALLCSTLLLHFMARGQERHADAIGISLTGDPEAFISGLAKLSRLNLLPLKSDRWDASLDTHPGTLGRLQDIARTHDISEQRFQELLAGSTAAEAGYATAPPKGQAPGERFASGAGSYARGSWARSL